jgi:hypothetical protein
MSHTIMWHVSACRILQDRKIFYAADAFTELRKFCLPESHLSESLRSQVPYFCYLLALCRSDSKGVAMRMVPSKRRSSFGTNCVQCTNELIAPERSECRNEGQIRHFWHCSKCDCSFEIILPARTKSMEDVMRRIEDVMRRRDVLRSRLVA